MPACLAFELTSVVSENQWPHTPCPNLLQLFPVYQAYLHSVLRWRAFPFPLRSSSAPRLEAGSFSKPFHSCTSPWDFLLMLCGSPPLHPFWAFHFRSQNGFDLVPEALCKCWVLSRVESFKSPLWSCAFLHLSSSCA